MKNEEMGFLVEFINYMCTKGFKCYFEKDTGNSKINREEKVVILDINDPDLLEKIWIAKEIANQIHQRSQITAARNQ